MKALIRASILVVMVMFTAGCSTSAVVSEPADGDSAVEAEPITPPEPTSIPEPTAGAEPTPIPEATTAPDREDLPDLLLGAETPAPRKIPDATPVPTEAPAVLVQVLVVTQDIGVGTAVDEILASPTTFLTARAVPEQFVAERAISSIDELAQLSGMQVKTQLLPGEQLLPDRFGDLATFDSGVAAVVAPEGHLTLVIEQPASTIESSDIRVGDAAAMMSSSFDLVVRKVLVLRVEDGPSSTAMVTVAFAPEHIDAVAAALAEGPVTLLT